MCAIPCGRPTAFAYSFWDGVYGMRKGELYPINNETDFIFIKFDNGGMILASIEPGVVSADNVVWFTEQKESEARAALLSHESKMVDILEEKIKERRDKIRQLVWIGRRTTKIKGGFK